MKKITKILAVAVLISTFGGCKKTGVSNSTEAAKILLANERLSEEALRNEGNLFTNGKQAFKRVVDETRKYSKKVVDQTKKGKFEKDGNTYKWSEAGDYSNFISFFDSYAKSIEHNATVGSNLIDTTKKKIRIVNKWVDIGSDEILLVVDENKETIFSRTDGQYEICSRSQNDEGVNVYEMFIENFDTKSKSRMTYIPGMRYEYVSQMDNHILVIIADKDKGYWDIMTTSASDDYQDHYTFTNLVMKDEAIYEMMYSVFADRRTETNAIDLVSADGKSDLFSYSYDEIKVFTTGVNGLSHFEITTPESRVYNLSENDHNYPDNIDDYDVFIVGEKGDYQYFTSNTGNHPTAVMNNGKRLNRGDTFENGKVKVGSLSISPIGDQDFYANISFRFANNNINENFKSLKKIFDEYGLSFKGDYDSIVASAEYADVDRANFGKYYRWNGNKVDNISDIEKSLEIEKEKINAFSNLYQKYKDEEVVRRFSQAKLDSSYEFVTPSIVANGTISNAGMNITISNFSLKVHDTNLFDASTKYEIEFATAIEVQGEYYNLFPLPLNTSLEKEFNGGTSFELTQTTSFDIPLLEEGSYTLVAYIATSDEGIRVTSPVAVSTSSVNEKTISVNGISNRIYGSSNKIKIDSIKDATINIELSGEFTYASLYNELESYAYNHGMTTGANVEMLNNNSWVAIDSSTSIEKGTYRLKYISGSSSAYVVAVVK